VDFPIIKWWFFIAMLNYQRVPSIFGKPKNICPQSEVFKPNSNCRWTFHGVVGYTTVRHCLEGVLVEPEVSAPWCSSTSSSTWISGYVAIFRGGCIKLYPNLWGFTMVDSTIITINNSKCTTKECSQEQKVPTQPCTWTRAYPNHITDRTTWWKDFPTKFDTN